MTNQLQTYLRENTKLADDEILHICTNFRFIKTKRNQILEKEGKVCKHLYFITKGCLRLYQTDKKGRHITGYFSLEDSLITALTSFITEKPSRDFLVSLEPSEILMIERSTFFQLIEKYNEFKTLYNTIVQFAFIHSQMRVYSFLGMEGIDKLKWLIEHEPKLLSRISSKEIASYLGMTNSTLSKLRAKL